MIQLDHFRNLHISILEKIWVFLIECYQIDWSLSNYSSLTHQIEAAIYWQHTVNFSTFFELWLRLLGGQLRLFFRFCSICFSRAQLNSGGEYRFVVGSKFLELKSTNYYAKIPINRPKTMKRPISIKHPTRSASSLLSLWRHPA